MAGEERRNITYQLPAIDHAVVQQMASDMGLTISDLNRAAIHYFIKHPEIILPGKGENE
jgi:hypothetical protein